MVVAVTQGRKIRATPVVDLPAMHHEVGLGSQLRDHVKFTVSSTLAWYCHTDKGTAFPSHWRLAERDHIQTVSFL